MLNYAHTQMEKAYKKERNNLKKRTNRSIKKRANLQVGPPSLKLHMSPH